MGQHSSTLFLRHQDEEEDHTMALPDELLEHIFSFLPSSSDRIQCSLVCRRWLAVDRKTRHCLRLIADETLQSSAQKLLSRYDYISELTLIGPREFYRSVDDEGFAMICFHCLNVTRLELRRCGRIGDGGLAAVPTHCPGLRKLVVDHCDVGVAGINAVLRGCPSLEELSIRNIYFIKHSGGGGITSSASLRHLNLSKLSLSPDFSSLIAASPNLTSLSVSDCSALNWDIICKRLSAHSPTSISELRLSGTNITDNNLRFLGLCSHLQSVSITAAQECTDVGLAAITRRSSGLKEIHVSMSQRVDGSWLNAVAKQCPELRSLSLERTRVKADSLRQVAEGCRKLHCLSLSRIPAMGDAALAWVAVKCRKLQRLKVECCLISDRWLESLAGGCPELERLEVRMCEVTAEGVERFRRRRRTVVVEAVFPRTPSLKEIMEGIRFDS